MEQKERESVTSHTIAHCFRSKCIIRHCGSKAAKEVRIRVVGQAAGRCNIFWYGKEGKMERREFLRSPLDYIGKRVGRPHF